MVTTALMYMLILTMVATIVLLIIGLLRRRVLYVYAAIAVPCVSQPSFTIALGRDFWVEYGADFQWPSAVFASIALLGLICHFFVEQHYNWRSKSMAEGKHLNRAITLIRDVYDGHFVGKKKAADLARYLQVPEQVVERMITVLGTVAAFEAQLGPDSKHRGRG